MNKVIYGLVAIALLAFVISLMTEDKGASKVEQKSESEKMEMKESGDAMMNKEDGEAMMEKNEVGEAMMKKEDGDAMEVMEEEGEAMMSEEGDAMMVKAGEYTDYSPEKIAEADGAVLFFKASWCPSCRTADANIKKNAGDIPAGLTILGVDFDNSKDLKIKYGVTSQHTYVQVDAQGNLIKKWVGGNTLAGVLDKVI